MNNWYYINWIVTVDIDSHIMVLTRYDSCQDTMITICKQLYKLLVTVFCLGFLFFIWHIWLHKIFCDQFKQEKFIPGLSNDLFNMFLLSGKWYCHIATLFRMTGVKKNYLNKYSFKKDIWLNRFNGKRDCLRSTFTVINRLYLMDCFDYKEL